MSRRLPSLEKAVFMHVRAARQGLAGAEELADNQRARRICNGIGAEWFPAWLRDFVGALAPVLEPAAWIHDLDYTAGGGAAERRKADWRFMVNGFRAARADFPLDRLRRYAVMLTTVRFWVLLRLFGAAAFDRGGGER